MSVKFSDLPSASVLADANLFPLVADVSGTLTSEKATLAILKNYVLAGNAATATKLATARTINGVSFDGSANIVVTVPLSPATTSVIGGVIPDGTTITVDGSGVISATPPQTTVVHAFAFDGNNNLIYTQTAGTTFNYTTDGANSPYVLVDVGTSIYSYSLDNNGNLLATFTS
jgi:hypothetical protein